MVWVEIGKKEKLKRSAPCEDGTTQEIIQLGSTATLESVNIFLNECTNHHSI